MVIRKDSLIHFSRSSWRLATEGRMEDKPLEAVCYRAGDETGEFVFEERKENEDLPGSLPTILYRCVCMCLST